MNVIDNILGWAAIGAGASLAAMIWPFRRGTTGVFANLVIGIAGAIALGFASYLFYSPERETPARLLLAAAGAIGALLLSHLFWNRHARERVRSVASRHA